jgi:asparagine synthase (glutamine-hydrolysing)
VSGLVGILHHDGRPVDQTALDRMLAAIAHRGPDGSASHHGGRISLASNHLGTSSQATEAPLLTDRDLTLAADVRLDNRDELALTLGLPKGSTSDAALIVGAYRRWGEDCPGHLLGDFAFALWDAGRQTLFCARDHFGVKPFYYHADNRGFAFASEMKALLTLPQVPRRIDEKRIADFLVALIDDAGSTIYTDIACLPPRHSLMVTQAGVVLRAYWHLEPGTPPAGDAAEQLRAIFAEAVGCRLRGGDAIGAMLSGGLDSSSIACVAAPILMNERRAPLRTFSLVFDKTPELSERQFIEAVLSKGGFDPVFIDSDHYDPFADADGLLAIQGSVYLAPGLAVSRRLYQAAAQNGIRALLDGHGGDEVISHGHGRLHELARAGRWLALWREASGASSTFGKSRWPVFGAYFKHYGPARSVQRARRLAARALGRGPPTADEHPRWSRMVNPDLLARTDLVERYGAMRKAEATATKSEQTRHAWLLDAPRVSKSFAVLDHAAAASGVEPRYPFWDKRLVELCLSLPSDEKLRDGWARSILRRAMAGILPASVQWRRDKLDFGPHIVRGMLTRHRELLHQVIHEGSGDLGAFVERSEVAAAYARIVAKPDAFDGYDVQVVWRATMLALWLRRIGHGSEGISAAA